MVEVLEVVGGEVMVVEVVAGDVMVVMSMT
jgi:hypothetical protein